jgi:hypothetical protein
MRRLLSIFATWLSRFCCLAAIACAQPESNVDLLEGMVACGTTTCGTGELCIDLVSDGSDGSEDPIDTYSCVAPPSDCPLDMCFGTSGSDACPPCLINLCGPVTNFDGERTLTCYGF